MYARQSGEARVAKGVQIERFKFGARDCFAMLLSQARFFDVTGTSGRRKQPFF